MNHCFHVSKLVEWQEWHLACESSASSSPKNCSWGLDLTWNNSAAFCPFKGTFFWADQLMFLWHFSTLLLAKHQRDNPDRHYWTLLSLLCTYNSGCVQEVEADLKDLSFEAFSMLYHNCIFTPDVSSCFTHKLAKICLAENYSAHSLVVFKCRIFVVSSNWFRHSYLLNEF